MTSLEERYRIAKSIGPGARDAALLHGPVRPRWSADGRWLWYAKRGEGGIEHVRVDVGSCVRGPLFDHAALARALAAARGGPKVKAIDGNQLPIHRVGLDPARNLVSFSTEGARWTWHDASRTLERVGPAFGPHEVPSPDERRAVALDGPNLAVREADSDQFRRLTDDGVERFGWGDFIDFTLAMTRSVFGPRPQPHVIWSPDSSRLAVLRVDRRPIRLLPFVQAVPAEGTRPMLHTQPVPMFGDAVDAAPAEVWFIGLDGSRVKAQVGVLESFTHRAFTHGQGRWSSDGRHFWIVDNNRATTTITLWRVDTHDGRAERVVHESGPGVVRAAPTLGMDPLYQPLSDGRVLWWSQRDGWGHLWLLGPGDRAVQVTRGAWQVRELLHVDKANERIVFAAGGKEPGVDPYFQIVYSIGFDGGNLRRLTPDDTEHEAYRAATPGTGQADLQQTVSPDGATFVDVGSTTSLPPVSTLRSTETGESLLELDRADASVVWPKALPLPEPFSLPSLDASLGDARELWGLLYKPLDFDPSKRYPVIEVIYAAPQMQVVPKGWQPGLHATFCEQLAALGFVVFILDGPGTPMRSHTFQLASYKRMEICGNLPDHVAALRELASTRPWMDLDRVGIAGGSGGGFATVRAMADHPDFYRVGVSLCGSHDSTNYIPYWGEMFQGPYDPAIYANQDNARVAHRISGKLFLIQGEMDDNVHPATTLRVVDALIKADRDFDLLIVPNFGHMLTHSPYVQRRVFDYFVTHLMRLAPPRPAPDPSPSST
jgi:dipeptidyl aminopeptidase/acylaminoacyl peptidase